MADDNSEVRRNPTATRPYYQRSDLGNAELLRDAYGSEIRYVPEVGRWYAYHAGRWIDDYDMTAERIAQRVALLLRDLAAGLPADQRKPAMRYATGCGMSARLRGMLYAARSLDDMHVSVTAFDADPYLLNCANGTLDLHSGELRGHDPGDLLTKTTAVAYDPAAVAPAFHTMLARVVPDPDVRGFLERYFGMSIVGTIREHVLAVMVGSGANGKTTVCEAVRGTLGEYGATASPNVIMQAFHDGGPSDGIANLRGRRLVLLAESDAGRKLSEATVKMLTGGDTIRARRLYENEIEFRPSHTMVMFTNHRPEVVTGGDALWRRLRVVPFDVTIPPDEQDHLLSEALVLERAGILTWLVNGCLDYMSHGLPHPDIMRESGESYREDEDHIAQFLTDETIALPGALVERKRLYKSYLDWCEVAGQRPHSGKRFGNAVREHGLTDGGMTHGGIRHWSGVTLRSE